MRLVTGLGLGAATMYFFDPKLGRTRRENVCAEMLEGNWSEATRTMVGAGSSVLLALGAIRRAPLSCVLGTAGLMIISRRALEGLGTSAASPDRNTLKDQVDRISERRQTGQATNRASRQPEMVKSTQ